MASGTQLVADEFSIPFALSQNQQSFRFFELPDELVDLITSGSNPRLQLKSADESPTNAPPQTPKSKSNEYVHLCSEELQKSWAIRQVSTSNEVYVVQVRSHGEQIGQDFDGDTDMSGAVLKYMGAGLIAVGKTDSVLELLPSTVDVELQLRRLLPTYTQAQLVGPFERGTDYARSEVGLQEMTRLAARIPAADVSICDVWRRLCISWSPQGSEGETHYFIPTSQLLESAWISAFSSYIIRTAGKGVMKKVDMKEEGQSSDELAGVKAALWDHLGSSDGHTLDKEKTTTWVGQILWDSMWTSPAPRYPKTEITEQIEELWRDLLPNDWKSDVAIDRLKAGSYEKYEEGQMQMVRWTAGAHSGTDQQSKGSKTGKNKWHEKFRNSRNSTT